MGRARLLALLVILALPTTLLGAIPPGTAEAPDCGVTTLEGTVVDSNSDGVLECGPPQPMVVRQELAAAQAGREGRRAELGTFFTLSDFQYVDEESPLRGEWADKCTSHPADAAFRPHETTVGHLMEAHVRAANRIAEGGGPILGEDLDFSVALGDLADNQQYNETRFFIDLLDGGGLVNPDSGDPGDVVPGGDSYHGVQGTDPEGAPAQPLTDSDGADIDILEMANEPFWADGLRRADGGQIPWYSVIGNHDMKVQGTIPDDDPAWRAFVRQWVLGNIKVMDLDPDTQQDACEGGGFTDQSFWTTLLTACAANPLTCGGNTQLVPADANRRLLDKANWIGEHFTTAGWPIGHGFADPGRRCPTDPYPDYAPRACYSFDQGLFRFLVVDTAAAEGLSEGNVDEAQLRWLEEELQAASRRYYAPDGSVVQNSAGSNRLIVIASHHTISSTENTGPRTGAEPGSQGEIFTGAAVRDLLLRFPNVILQVSGHTHQNRVWPHQNPSLGTGYWEVNTAAVTDYPTQSRTIEIADNGDGTMSIFAVTFDAAVPPNPRDIHGVHDDHTHETAHGANQDVNEDWLAAAGREVQYHDPQGNPDRLGAPEDRNVELVVGRPFRLPTSAQIDRCLRHVRDGVTPVLGGGKRDVLRGTPGPDVICGFGGKDRIRGMKGNDILLGGGGPDRLGGGRGHDLLKGGGGRDRLNGHRGRDRLVGQRGVDTCRGGPGKVKYRSCERIRDRRR